MIDPDPRSLADLLGESLARGQTPALQVVSGSMSPLIVRNDRLTLAPVAVETLAPGQIITCLCLEPESFLLTHRICALTNGSSAVKIITRGDRNLNFDAPIDADQVIGRVVTRSRNGRTLPLHSRRGRWLDKQLMRASAADYRLRTGRRLPKSLVDPAFIEEANIRAAAYRPGPVESVAAMVIRLGSRWLVRLFDLCDVVYRRARQLRR